MYTGVIEEPGTLNAVDRLESGCRVEIATETTDLQPEDSIAVNGVCLTASAVGDGWFRAVLSAETVDRTYLAGCKAGGAVNIERPLGTTGRFDGHVVKGTVDTVTQVTDITDLGEDWLFEFDVPAGYEQYLVEKGAVALDGIGLTVADLSADTFTVAVVPTTYDVTTLSAKEPGDPVHFEADILAKYVERQRAVGAL
jgi:riboflavin synthase